MYLRRGKDGPWELSAPTTSEFLEAALLYEGVWQLSPERGLLHGPLQRYHRLISSIKGSRYPSSWLTRITALPKSVIPVENCTAAFTYIEKISIVGLTGAGKTTLIKLLCRLYEPQSGQIRVNGRDIREYDVEDNQRSFFI